MREFLEGPPARTGSIPDLLLSNQNNLGDDHMLRIYKYPLEFDGRNSISLRLPANAQILKIDRDPAAIVSNQMALWAMIDDVETGWQAWTFSAIMTGEEISPERHGEHLNTIIHVGFVIHFFYRPGVAPRG